MPTPRTSTSKTAARPRREPTQKRAIQTRLLIFEASMRLLEAEGLAAFNTNRLAQVSGFSIGTIYQYFDGKRDLLSALARHEIDAALAAARRRAERSRVNVQTDNPATRARAAVRNLLGVFGGRLQARRQLLQAALSGGGEAPDYPVRALAALLEERLYTSEVRGPHRLDPDEAFVLAHAVMGAVRGALLSDAGRLRSAAFENALVRLIAGFFAVAGSRPALRPEAS